MHQLIRMSVCHRIVFHVAEQHMCCNILDFLPSPVKNSGQVRKRLCVFKISLPDLFWSPLSNHTINAISNLSLATLENEKENFYR